MTSIEEGVIQNQRHLFEIPESVAYLNCAQKAPQMISVRRAGEQALERSAHPWKYDWADWFGESEKLRSLFGKIINSDAEGVALVPATSYGLATAAHNLEARPCERILLLAEDFPSNVYTWQCFGRRTGAEVLTVTRGESQSWTEAILESFDERVKIISVPNVHWTNGALIDLRRVGERARALGAVFIVDASQSLGVMPLDVAELRPDYLVSVGYKWQMGPLSLSYLYVDESRRDGRPLENNWIARANAEDFSRLIDYTEDYKSGARRFDVGQRPNLILNPMAIAALSQLLDWEIPRIAQTLGELTRYVEQRAREYDLKVLSEDERGPHLIGIDLGGANLSEVSARLAERQIYVSIRGSSVRIAPHLYNSRADIDRFFEVLETVL